MESIFSYVLPLHISSGTIALIMAPLALITSKGGSAHRRWGKIFFWCMAILAATALIMSVRSGNIFLTMVAVFSFYLAASGYRSLYRRHINSFSDVQFIDWILVILSGLFCLAMLVFGFILIFTNSNLTFGIISMVFGFIGTRSVMVDVKSFRIVGFHKKNWLYFHMGNMMGAYIATLSAFSAVNFSFLPGVLRWLWPTIVGVPLLILYIRKYRSKKSLRNSLPGI
jgi:hypothetical protein